MREWRKTHPLNEKQKQKANARAHASIYGRRGLINKDKCILCGAIKRLQFHHPDYSYPLRVICLCKDCHKKTHREKIVFTEDQYAVVTVKRHGDINICIKCKVEPRIVGQKWCKKCHAENMRIWRKKQKLKGI
jgi:hypothetical protein